MTPQRGARAGHRRGDGAPLMAVTAGAAPRHAALTPRKDPRRAAALFAERGFDAVSCPMRAVGLSKATLYHYCARKRSRHDRRHDIRELNARMARHAGAARPKPGYCLPRAQVDFFFEQHQHWFRCWSRAFEPDGPKPATRRSSGASITRTRSWASSATA
jgi:AcrR family transcriptional regulator